ncbi:MAG: hypothetical protein ABIU06_17895 [Anaerolineales bacterium]
MIVGIASISDYGESWDEARLYSYADQSIQAYPALFDRKIPVDFGDDDLRYYGPAYLMGMSLLVEGFQNLFPRVPRIDLWHIGNFVCLQFGLICFYFLARRFTSMLPTLTTTALLSSQPLLWGHGFINPKDIPFMTFFMASILAGLKMLDELEKQDFSLKTWIHNSWFYVAGIFLGITVSIRILGLAAGIIVLFHLFLSNPHKALRLSYAYFGLALIISFLTWPYLWTSPVINFLKSLYVMLKFQWVGHVLFDGMYYRADQVPRAYFPQLFSMQLTEPALILFCAGFLILFLTNWRKKHHSLILLILVWFIVPITYILVKGINLYDNTRQLLFIFPPVFLIISVGWEFIFVRLKTLWVRILIILIIVAPGVAGIVEYHPFEYTYYNFFSVHTRQIFRNFETDYFATSYKEASNYLNENAPKNTLIVVWGPSQIVQNYARRDLQVKGFDDLKNTNYSDEPFYLVLSTRYEMDLQIYPDIYPIYSVEHNHSVLSVVKYIP